MKLAKYMIKYWFEHGGTCLWSVSENAKSLFGYPIENNKLPISKDLINELYLLEDEYKGYLDWEYPLNPSPWNQVQKNNFKKRANIAYNRLLLELGDDYEVINEVDRCVK